MSVRPSLNLPLEIEDTKAILPHRYPFLLVDRILEFEEARRIVGLKNVTSNERYFIAGPGGVPILPASILTEAMAQAGAVLVLAKPENRSRLIYFMGIDRVRHRRPGGGGDHVMLEGTVVRLRSQMGGRCGADRPRLRQAAGPPDPAGRSRGPGPPLRRPRRPGPLGLPGRPPRPRPLRPAHPHHRPPPGPPPHRPRAPRTEDLSRPGVRDPRGAGPLRPAGGRGSPRRNADATRPGPPPGNGAGRDVLAGDRPHRREEPG